MKRLLLLVLLVALPGCGDDNKTPTAPTPPPQPAQIAGGWSGTFESSNYTAQAIYADLTQVNANINGTWAQTSGIRANGTITGTVDTANFSGTITYSYPNSPTTCQASFSGSANSATLNWTSPGFTGNCSITPNGNPLNVRFVLQRR